MSVCIHLRVEQNRCLRADASLNAVLVVLIGVKRYPLTPHINFLSLLTISLLSRPVIN